MKLKKQPFILFELLIAIALISFTALPFIHYPFVYLKNEVRSLKRMELERIVETALIDTKAKLYQHEVSWEALTRQKKASLPDIDEKVTFQLPPNIKETFLKKVYFWQAKHKKEEGGQEKFLIHVQTTFTPEKQKKPTMTIKQQIYLKQLPKKLQ